MNADAYDAAAIGNHEFNYGVPTLDRAVRQARVSAACGQRVHARRRTTLSAVGDVDAPRRQDRDRRRNDARRDGLGSRQPRRPARRSATSCPRCATAVREARDAGADVVIVVVHSGLNEPSSYDTVSTGVAERERRGPRRARGAGHRSDRLRALAQGDGRHGHR